MWTGSGIMVFEVARIQKIISDFIKVKAPIYRMLGGDREILRMRDDNDFGFMESLADNLCDFVRFRFYLIGAIFGHQPCASHNDKEFGASGERGDSIRQIKARFARKGNFDVGPGSKKSSRVPDNANTRIGNENLFRLEICGECGGEWFGL